MKLYRCQKCGQMLYFENTQCERCGSRLGYIPQIGVLNALAPDGDVWRPLGQPSEAATFEAVRFCDNMQHGVCNWVIPAGSADQLCLACRHNQTIPPLDNPDNVRAWGRLEGAKHRLIYSLLRLDLPMQTRMEDAEHGLAFDFLADPPPVEQGPRVMTGHDNGLITIALAEADDAERESRRVSMGEPYRTLLGHFRHEVGHHYWDLLVRDENRLDEFRSLFGDERQDYGEALQRHYAEGPPAGWQGSFVSSYAAAHPWEDFAETWAHYLHMVDTLEMAQSFGLRVDPVVADDPGLTAEVVADPYRAARVEDLVTPWLPLCFAMNSLGRTMGQGDLYPFVLSPPVIEKLGFVHRVVHAPRGQVAETASAAPA
ncbi:zinc-binding metallopeptidase family protein [Rhodopila sp.]|jgi:hypothetical protein|uniref:zinc-binding metallopeptidase family protein n=1 Tax=Rhodopila sp. TaxID=2480087 RepID=UPI002C1AA3CB|nr:putative zinc-binding peptidase [Rhodopila sp.]HVZ07280.1 putative zinc-binding peptidase [Rhodopila sp.]